MSCKKRSTRKACSVAGIVGATARAPDVVDVAVTVTAILFNIHIIVDLVINSFTIVCNMQYMYRILSSVGYRFITDSTKISSCKT